MLLRWRKIEPVSARNTHNTVELLERVSLHQVHEDTEGRLSDVVVANLYVIVVVLIWLLGFLAYVGRPSEDIVAQRRVTFIALRELDFITAFFLNGLGRNSIE